MRVKQCIESLVGYTLTMIIYEYSLTPKMATMTEVLTLTLVDGGNCQKVQQYLELFSVADYKGFN